MTIADIKKTAETKMAKSIEAFKNELQKIRTGRAHPGILDQVHVDYYGSMVPISQVANVSCSMRARSACSPGKRAWAPRSRRPSARATWA
jgi:ribosome recycling factor